MKIGVVTNDGRTISPHFGMARFYAVFDIEDGVIKGKEMRPKAWHEHTAGKRPGRDSTARGGGMHHDGNQRSTHHEMLSNIGDCEALVAKGMGRPMYEAILEAGIKPYVTSLGLAEEAVLAYAKGTLDNQERRLH